MKLNNLDTQFKGKVFLKKTDFKDEKFKAFDFSEADFNHPIFSGVLFEDCWFENTKFTGARFYNCSFLNCFFSKAVLKDSAIGVQGGGFKDCVFEGVDFSKAIFYRPFFIHCVFNKSKLRNIDFSASRFEDCKFIGKLNNIYFRKYYSSKEEERLYGKTDFNLMKNVDFSGAILEYVEFVDCDLSTIIPPNNNDHLYIDNLTTVVKRSLVEVNTQWDGELKKLATRRLNKLLGLPAYLFNINTLKKLEGDAFAEMFVNLLRKNTH